MKQAALLTTLCSLLACAPQTVPPLEPIVITATPPIEKPEESVEEEQKEKSTLPQGTIMSPMCEVYPTNEDVCRPVPEKYVMLKRSTLEMYEGPLDVKPFSHTSITSCTYKSFFDSIKSAMSDITGEDLSNVDIRSVDELALIDLRVELERHSEKSRKQMLDDSILLSMLYEEHRGALIGNYRAYVTQHPEDDFNIYTYCTSDSDHTHMFNTLHEFGHIYVKKKFGSVELAEKEDNNFVHEAVAHYLALNHFAPELHSRGLVDDQFMQYIQQQKKIFRGAAFQYVEAQMDAQDQSNVQKYMTSGALGYYFLDAIGPTGGRIAPHTLVDNTIMDAPFFFENLEPFVNTMEKSIQEKREAN